VTNTLRWYSREWVERAVIGIGTAALIAGVYFDGYLYWITEQTAGTVQGYSLENGVFNRVAAWAMPAGYSLPTGITGDGQDLYVALTFTDAGPPIAITRRIVRFTKTGTLVRDMGFSAPTSVTVNDLDFNGQNLMIALVGTAAAQQIAYMDLPTAAIVYGSPTLPRLPHALTFDGNHCPAAVVVAGFYYGVTFDVQGALLTSITILPLQPYGCSFVKDGVGDQGTPDFFSGESVVVAFRA